MAYAVHIKLEENKNDISDLKQIIAVQSAQIERNTKTIYHLLGGLFNQQTQTRILNLYTDGLFGKGADASEGAATEVEAAGASDDDEDDASEADDDEDDASESEDDDYEKEKWPTTRQGDEHEERLKEMEERFRQLEEQVVEMEKRQFEKFGKNKDI
jgi:hypothetical protein